MVLVTVTFLLYDGWQWKHAVDLVHKNEWRKEMKVLSIYTELIFYFCKANLLIIAVILI